MQMPNHLVQIVAEPYELSVIQASNVGMPFAGRSGLAIFIEKQRSSEMNRTHTERPGALTEIFILCRCET